MPILSAGQLERMRAIAVSHYDQTCQILSRATTDDGYASKPIDGAATESACRTAQLSFDERQADARLQKAVGIRLFLPHDAELAEDQTVVIDGVKWRVLEVQDEHSGPRIELRATLYRKVSQ